jgi:hypothetical protein
MNVGIGITFTGDNPLVWLTQAEGGLRRIIEREGLSTVIFLWPQCNVKFSLNSSCKNLKIRNSDITTSYCQL